MHILDPSLFRLELLRPEITVRSFCCSENELTDYLHDEALRDQQYLFSTTHLLFYENVLVGYFALVGDTINPKKIDEEISKKYEYAKLPALKIARLAVDKKYAGMGVGSLLLSHIYNMAIEIQKTAGFRLLTVDAKRDAQTFYEHFQFRTVKYSGNRDTIPMYFDIRLLLEDAE